MNLFWDSDPHCILFSLTVPSSPPPVPEEGGSKRAEEAVLGGGRMSTWRSHHLLMSPSSLDISQSSQQWSIWYFKPAFYNAFPCHCHSLLFWELLRNATLETVVMGFSQPIKGNPNISVFMVSRLITLPWAFLCLSLLLSEDPHI